MASHFSIIQIYKDHPKILIYLFVFVLITHAQLPRCWTWLNPKLIHTTEYLSRQYHITNMSDCVKTCEAFLYCELVVLYQQTFDTRCYVNDEVILERRIETHLHTQNAKFYQMWRQNQECLMGKCWTKHAGKGIRGFVNTPNERSLYYCAQKCMYAKEGCLHITYRHSEGKPCWIDTERRKNIQWENVSGANSYSVDKQCWATTTRIITPITKAPRQGLPKCWYEMHNVVFQKVDNGYATNFSACIDTCEQTRHCIVISWKEGATWPCWYNKWSIDLWVHDDNAAYDSYAKDVDCLLFPEGTCWKKKSSFEYTDVAYKSEYSLITCMEACLNDSCTMFTYYHGISYPCYVGTKRGVTQPAGRYAENVDSYILDANCLTSTKTITTTTSIRTTTPTTVEEITEADPGIVTEPSIETEPTMETEPSMETDPEDETGSDNETYVIPKSKAISKTVLSLYCCIVPLVFLARTLLNMHALH